MSREAARRGSNEPKPVERTRPTNGSPANARGSARRSTPPPPAFDAESAYDAQAAPPVLAPADPSKDDPRAWSAIVAVLTSDKPALGAVLSHGAPVEVGAQRIVLSFPVGSFFGHQAATAASKTAIAHAARTVLGREPVVEITYGDAPNKTLAQEEVERKEARVKATREKALTHPLVVEAARVFQLPRERLHVRIEAE